MESHHKSALTTIRMSNLLRVNNAQQYESLKKYVLRDVLKEFKDGDVLMLAGRVFHVSTAAIEKARHPNSVRDGETIKSPASADRSWRRAATELTGSHIAAM